jgi:hypothetical protein
MSSYEMEMEDFLIDLKRKVAVVEQQNQDLREVNSRLTLALDEALAMARKYRGGNAEEEDFEQSREGNAGRSGGLWGVLTSPVGQLFRRGRDGRYDRPPLSGRR